MEWHTKQATKLSKNARERASLFWEIGIQLNLENQGDLSASTKQAYADIYDINPDEFSSFRRFADECPSSPHRTEVINKYHSWTSIKNDFLRGKEPGDSYKEKEAAKEKRYSDKPKSTDDTDDSGAHFSQRSFNMNHEVVESVAIQFGWTTDYAAKTMRILTDEERAYFVNIFVTLLKRKGFTTVK